jgi:hypothetical protein
MAIADTFKKAPVAFKGGKNENNLISLPRPRAHYYARLQ